jgi:hypothetical protein
MFSSPQFATDVFLSDYKMYFNGMLEVGKAAADRQIMVPEHAS